MHPPALCAHWLAHPNIELVTHTEVTALQQTEHGWQASTQGEPLTAAVVVVASAAQARTLLPGLPLKRSADSCPRCRKPRIARRWPPWSAAKAYLAPAREGRHCLGASFVFDRKRHRTQPGGTPEQPAPARELSPALAAGYAAENWKGRVAFRCTSPDYLPWSARW